MRTMAKVLKWVALAAALCNGLTGADDFEG